MRSILLSLFFAALLPLSTMAQMLEDEPHRIEGEFKFQSSVVPKFFQQGSTAALLCANTVLKPSGKWLTKSEQILGRFTSSVDTSPLKFEIDLPVRPNCSAFDFGRSGSADQGVQLLVAAAGINLFGDSYLEQLEQASFFPSISTDSSGVSVLRGTFLAYAPDNSRRVSSGFGPDKRLFTSDDPTVSVPAGYSVLRINDDRTISVERAGLMQMDILQPVETIEADFSSRGILGSFDALINLLKNKYAYTELRKIDWDKKRAQFRPRFEDADRRHDLGDYYVALFDFAASMRDAHVQTGSYAPQMAGKRQELLSKRLAGNLGAQLIRYSDGRFVVTSVGKNSPAAQAGLKTGTEIVRINGKSALEHVESIPPLGFSGTDEAFIERANALFFSFPTGESVKVEYRQPGEKETRTATLIAGDFESGGGLPSLASFDAIKIDTLAEGQFGYFRWQNFENVNLDMDGLESMLARSKYSKGVILDLRGNTGGLLTLMYSMASFFFEKEKAVSIDWLDTYRYDPVQKDFVTPQKTGGTAKIFSPREDLTFRGSVVVLVDRDSASAAEFFSQFLQRQGRAVVIADSGTDGAGGIVASVAMPENVPFTFTAGRTYFAGTKEVNLEGKGVTPDIRVKIDDKFVERRLKGEDVVLAEAIRYLSEKTSGQ